jgi:hypothetical protein
MISSSLTDIEVGLDQGHAMIEVAEIRPENDIRVTQDGAAIQLLKTGLYDFDQRQHQIRVFDGSAIVQDGGQQVTVKSGREVSLSGGGSLKAYGFDRKAYTADDLYRWSSLRSAYLAEANVDAAGIYATSGGGPWGPGWWGTGWYWDSWYDAYTFIPVGGIFFSPFGWGFYSPGCVHRSPLAESGYVHPVGYGNDYHHFSADYRNWGSGPHYVGVRDYANGIYRGPGSSGRGFHSGPRTAGLAHSFGAFRGGGSHGGGGGFRGGGGSHGGGGGGHGH